MTLTHCRLLEIKIHSVSCRSWLKPQTWRIKILKNMSKLFITAPTYIHAHLSGVVGLEFSKDVTLVHVCCGIRHMFMQLGRGVVQLTWAPGSGRRRDAGRCLQVFHALVWKQWEQEASPPRRLLPETGKETGVCFAHFFFPRSSTLSHSGFSNTIAQTEWLQQRTLISPSSGGWKWERRAPAWLGSWGAPPSGSHDILPVSPPGAGQRGTKEALCPCAEALTHSCALQSRDPTTSQRLHLLPPSHWGWGLQREFQEDPHQSITNLCKDSGV